VLDEDLEALAVERAEVAARRDARAKELDGLRELGELTLGEIAEDAAWDRGTPAAWAEALSRLGAAEQSRTAEIVALDFELADLDEEMGRKRARRTALDDPGVHDAATLELDVGVENAGELELSVSYVVPGACWRPRHTARLLSGSAPRVRFECEGSAWQSTGEDWTDVTLCFSTERLSLGAEPPLLSTDVLSVARKSPALTVEARDHRIEQAGLGADATRPQGLPGIDDGGDVQRLRGRHKASVPSDGRPYRVPLFAFDAPAQTGLTLMPELAQAVILESVQANTGASPILAGPVDLIQDSGFVGRASVLFVAPGEKFALGWGPDAALRVQREVVELEEESNLIGSWRTRTLDVKVHLSNLGDVAKALRLTERVPVSELEKVQISTVPAETTGGKRADDRGFVVWSVTLPAFGRETVRLRYLLKKHSDVVGV
jgi:uncharacterized protein (TIGR02231 family)